jgi:hypothetical protein
MDESYTQSNDQHNTEVSTEEFQDSKFLVKMHTSASTDTFNDFLYP